MVQLLEAATQSKRSPRNLFTLVGFLRWKKTTFNQLFTYLILIENEILLPARACILIIIFFIIFGPYYICEYLIKSQLSLATN